MRNIILLLLFILSVLSLNAQDLRMERMKPVGINTAQSPEWGTDVLMLNYEPIGPIAGIRASNGTIYVAVNDTLSTGNLGLIILQSSNNGTTWSSYSWGLTYRGKYENLKMVTTGAGPDSIYLFNQIGNTVYIWNFLNLTLNQFPTAGNVRTFDAVGSSTGALYVFSDSLQTTNISRRASTDGGLTWGTRGSVTVSGAIPKASISPGDTIVLTYYSTTTIIGTDTSTAVIKLSRYRQLANGTISVISLGTTPSDLASEPQSKNEFTSALGNGTLWFMYTIGTTGNINIKARCSRDGGFSYGDTLLIAGNPNTDEYWFDVKFNRSTVGAFDFIYYSDSLQSGQPTNGTDKILFSKANYTDSTGFPVPTQISTHPPSGSSANYKPVLIELAPGDAGIVWVGYNGAGRSLYWDLYSMITRINGSQTAYNYNLSQNYPNPFNPSTKINYEIQKTEFVSLKVYDIIGREVATLINRTMQPGAYQVTLDGSKLSSGVYFYKLTAGDFTGIKRMILVK